MALRLRASYCAAGPRLLRGRAAVNGYCAAGPRLLRGRAAVSSYCAALPRLIVIGYLLFVR